MKTIYEVWYGPRFEGAFDTIEEARAVRRGLALHLGVFERDISITRVVNEA